MSGSIRPARADDRAAIETCVRAAYAKYVPRMGKEPAPMLADYATLIAAGVVHVLADRSGVRGVVVCFAREGYFFLENVAVDPAHQGQGLGRAIALRLALDGARVAIAQRDPAPLERTAAEIRARGGEALAVPTDVAVPEQVARLVGAVRERLGPVDILVNNAGFNRRRPTFANVDLASWREVLATNLTGAFLCAQAVVPEMMARGWGRIINVSACPESP